MSTTRTQIFPCACCGGNRCAFKFATTYSNADCAWATPALAATQCGTSDGEPLNTWIYDSPTAAHQWMYGSTACASAGDCGSAPAAPSAPPAPGGVGHCARQWTATYDCATSSWTGPTAGDIACVQGDSLDQWALTDSSGGVCTMAYNQDLGQCCGSPGDCPTDATGAPSLPDSSVCSCGGGVIAACPATCQDITAICGATITVTITGCLATDNLGHSLNGSHVLTFDAEAVECSYSAYRSSDGGVIIQGQCLDLSAFHEANGVGPASGSGVLFTIYGLFGGGNDNAYLYPLTAGACPQATTYAVLYAAGDPMPAGGWGEWSFS
jgi:hypothetical protein